MARRIISDKARELIKKYPDEAYEISQAGFEEGKTHIEPSEKTIKLIKNMEEKFDKLKDEIIDKVGKIEISLEKTVREIFDKIDEKYARKEKVDKLRSDIDEMKVEREARNYEWLKYAIITVISGIAGIASAFVIMHFKG